LLLRNPIIPAVVILFWEGLNPVLPALLQKLSVLYYLQALTPVPAPTDPGAPLLVQLFIAPAAPSPIRSGPARSVWRSAGSDSGRYDNRHREDPSHGGALMRPMFAGVLLPRLSAGLGNPPDMLVSLLPGSCSLWGHRRQPSRRDDDLDACTAGLVDRRVHAVVS
jgi:hypothetical protein